MFVLVIESLDVFITTVMLCVTVVTVRTFTFLKHYIMISCFVKDFILHAHYKTVNTMKLSHKLSDAVCDQRASHIDLWFLIQFFSSASGSGSFTKYREKECLLVSTSSSSLNSHVISVGGEPKGLLAMLLLCCFV